MLFKERTAPPKPLAHLIWSCQQAWKAVSRTQVYKRGGGKCSFFWNFYAFALKLLILAPHIVFLFFLHYYSILYPRSPEPGAAFTPVELSPVPPLSLPVSYPCPLRSLCCWLSFHPYHWSPSRTSVHSLPPSLECIKDCSSWIITLHSPLIIFRKSSCSRRSRPKSCPVMLPVPPVFVTALFQVRLRLSDVGMPRDWSWSNSCTSILDPCGWISSCSQGHTAGGDYELLLYNCSVSQKSYSRQQHKSLNFIVLEHSRTIKIEPSPKRFDIADVTMMWRGRIGFPA